MSSPSEHRNEHETAVGADAYDYPLDESLIAQAPLPERSQSRLMVLDRSAGRATHGVFSDLPRLLRRGDLLVLNNTRVIPARFFCRRASGGRIEGLFVRETGLGVWEAMLKGAGRCRAGEVLSMEQSDAQLELAENLGQGQWRLSVQPVQPAQEVLASAGKTPLPPYIHRGASTADAEDRARYQTVYATQPGAVAAPTAGLHFTPELLGQLSAGGIETAEVTLHVGMGTFLPVKVEDITRHKMHSEWYDLPNSTAAAINSARREGRRVIAVGTTTVRVLESAAASQGVAPLPDKSSSLAPSSGWTDIFIYPPYRFRVAEGLITNFHLPRSTLLMLVSAFASPGGTAGIEMIKRAYAVAQEQRYRFFSYGDAMLIM